MKLPIIQRLKKIEYRDIATFQDIVVDLLYELDSSVILHGGTAIWRCYSGKRFSNDIDVYLKSDRVMRGVKEKISEIALNYNMRVEKVKDTGNLLYIAFSLGDTYLKVDINYKVEKLKPTTMRYERIDGTYTDVVTLRSEDLILEKIEAYTDRRFIRDIYDIYVLSNYVTEVKAVKDGLAKFLKGILPPVNEPDLRAVIYEGPVPSYKNMVDYLKGRFS
jgi:predicted nucleotidyltransferase component of viral defense system